MLKPLPAQHLFLPGAAVGRIFDLAREGELDALGLAGAVEAVVAAMRHAQLTRPDPADLQGICCGTLRHLAGGWTRGEPRGGGGGRGGRGGRRGVGSNPPEPFHHRAPR